MKKYILFFILLAFNTYSQSITRIPSPADSGLNATDQSMVPIITKDNYLFCYTTKMVGAVQRYQVVKVNLSTNEVFLYPSSILSGSTNFFARPRNFQFYQNDIYFICGTTLNKLDFTTDTITAIATYCDDFYIFKNYLIYDYNSTQTYIKNLTTNTTLELKSGTFSLASIKGFYEYNNELYFRSRPDRISKFVAPNSTSTIYTAPYKASTISTSKTFVKRINDNLIYLLVSDGALKFVSINLLTNTANTNFSFDTKQIYDTYVNEPYVYNNLVYLTNANGVYTSNGSDDPLLTTLPFITSHATIYNNQIIGMVNSPTYGSELWKTDGTSAGTGILKDINSGLQGIGASFPIILNNTLYFYAYNIGTTGGWRIYKSDGSEENTVPIIPENYFLSSSTSQNSILWSYDNYIYFYAETPTESGLYKIDIRTTNLGTTDFEVDIKPEFYPNPAKDKVFSKNRKEIVELFSMEGILLDYSQNTNEIDLSSLSSGIYFIKSTDKTGKVVTQKIIKQ